MEQFRRLCCSWRRYRKLCKAIQKDQPTISHTATQIQGLFHAITQQCTDILTESKQGGPRTGNRKLARCRICVLQEDLLHQLPPWWLETVLQELCFTHYPQQIVTAYGIYLPTFYIWMNNSFIPIHFQDFLCQNYRRKKSGIFTFALKHWIAADPLDRCKNPWSSISKHKHFPDSL